MTLDELRSLASRLALSGESRQLILLDGPMGAGKTQFTKYFLDALGSHDTVSPSFAIHNSYETSRGLVHHFDLFRLESADDLETTGFWDLFDDDSFILVEWAEKLVDFGLVNALPTGWPTVQLKFDVAADGARTVREIR